ncbi:MULTISPECIES: S-adenosyl-l-methionine hydroxide adenosyltransferase family protein [Oceanobacillus]|uniref:DNA-directed RNA polymerase subunit delta n=1 Tax=Oceanobacillus kimchii TaxID=746691 RepID=A0ABQ5TIP9_9BACI|nr:MULTISPECIES: S-adenosyl-l-methionine hydroxide adenosyltransferase family protein [Oceanobacillus]MBT2599222.1 S-adenosyl-l-methionine hydroxide adenosyltransferase family protein [Oceanobacillus sp. ISL-74]MBT2652140.1 S-adenosyl-l-methionine hydroxide adenosyltransferase family protein [Oceanobacillus sp. ISL-73]MCT1578577.1 S-adenosyl-l-methionine hydroxide adenosyltransferase family protein [Oceanobacillus kimchii]MCT2136374.1 S-adenosyl-l-methionine hydroxide adenosyltransferase family
MKNPLVLQTDFGLSDGAVNAMYGVSISVDSNLRIYDLTHDIPPFNIWDASYRLSQTIDYWPEGTIFISVVDPGVGTDRLSIVAKTKSNHYIVTPNNGTLTHVADRIGITEVRKIDERVNRLPRSGESYTFHGRDVYAYTGARLASGNINYEGVGPSVDISEIITLPLPGSSSQDGIISGNIDILDVRFGNLWTNIDREMFIQERYCYGDWVEVSIENERKKKYQNHILFGRSFAETRLGEPLLFVNSLDKLAVAINQGSFANAYQIETGSDWRIYIKKSQQK